MLWALQPQGVLSMFNDIVDAAKKAFLQLTAPTRFALERKVKGCEEIFTLSDGDRERMLRNFLKITHERKGKQIHIFARDGLPELQSGSVAKRIRKLLESGCDVHIFTGDAHAATAIEGVVKLTAFDDFPNLKLWQTNKEPTMFYCLLPHGQRSCVYYELDLDTDRDEKGHIKGRATALCPESYVAKFMECSQRNMNKQLTPNVRNTRRLSPLDGVSVPAPA